MLGMLSLGSVPAEVEERLQGMSVIDDIKSLHADTLSAIGKVPNTDALEKIRVEVVGNQPSDAKNSLVSLTTVPESSSSASRFGMLIRPLKVSAMLHSRPRSIVAPRMDTKE